MAIFPGSAIPSAVSAYDIDNSCRFNEPDDSDLTRTWGTSTSLTTWTISFWVKRSNLGAEIGDAMVFATAQTGGGPGDTIMSQGYFSSGDAFVAGHDAGSFWTTSQLFRDTSSWYHMMMVCNTTETTDSDRLKLFVNGSQVTDFSATSYPDEDAELGWGKAQVHYIGENYNGDDTFGGYLAEFYSIDGQALTPSSFGEINATTNQWVPIEYEGTYGNEGFYLKFQDKTALGDDSSGNTNDFASSGLSNADWMTDTPTRNFCTMNPLNLTGSTVGLSEGNLHLTTSTSAYPVLGTYLIPSSGKWYWETYVVAIGEMQIGFVEADVAIGDMYANKTTYVRGGTIKIENVDQGVDADSYTSGDIIGIAYSADANTVTFYKNGSQTGDATYALTPGKLVTPYWVQGSLSNTCEPWTNFGADSSFGRFAKQENGGAGEDFYYTPPTGFTALNTANISSPEIVLPGENFNTILYDDGAGAKTGVGFQPDLVWLKSRGSTYEHEWTDSVRGVTKATSSDSSAAETTDSTGLTAFGADGFTVGADTNYSDTTGTGMVGWNWKAGGTPTADNDNAAGAVPDLGSVMIDGVASTAALAGTIAATRLSANTTAGFSIVKFPGNGVTGTIAHGLSQTPELVIQKSLGAAQHWLTGHDRLHAGASPWDYYVYLSLVSAESASTNAWNDTAPAGTVYTAGGLLITAANSPYVSYCFHSVEGYSRVGRYEGNGDNDGTFVYTGFRPMWVMSKGADTEASWLMVDSVRSPYNVTLKALFANETASTGTSSTYAIDILSNGFKCRGVNNNTNNSSGDPYIYLAFAESPFKYSHAR